MVALEVRKTCSDYETSMKFMKLQGLLLMN